MTVGVGPGAFPGADRRLGAFELLQQRGQGSHFVGLPVSHEQCETIESDLDQPLLLSSSGVSDRDQHRAGVSRVRFNRHVFGVFELPDLTRHEARVDSELLRDLRRAESSSIGQKRQHAQGARAFAPASGSIEARVHREQRAHHRLNIVSTWSHHTQLVDRFKQLYLPFPT
jgi:hypothetical protein